MIHIGRSITDDYNNVVKGYIQVKRRVLYVAFQTFAKDEGVDKPISAHYFYQQLRSLKLKVDEITVNNNKGLGFHPTQLYQECIQRGYEHADFTFGGFEKQQDIVDETEFTW